MPTGTLLVVRPAQFADMLRSYRIIVDGQKIGALGPGEELRSELPEGAHEMVARLDWTRSNFLPFEVLPGKVVEIEVSANCSGLKLLAALYYITFGYWHYLSLRQLETEAAPPPLPAPIPR